MTAEPTLDDVRAARALVDRHLPRAPLEPSPPLSADFGVPVYLKIETFKPTRAFKARGALNAIAGLDDEARLRGVVAVSGGNHGLGVAYAAMLLGVSATIVMPEQVSAAIQDGCRGFGATVVLRGRVVDDAMDLVRAIERDERRTFISPYADPRVIAGQGTIGLEILDELPDAGTILTGVGGGGLVCGLGLAVKASGSRARVIGVEPATADAMRRSVAAGRPVVLDEPRSVAERLLSKTTGELNVALARRYVDDLVTVTDDALVRATRELIETAALLVEPAGAAGLAALRSGVVRAEGPTVLVITGGNVSPELLARVLGAASAP